MDLDKPLLAAFLADPRQPAARQAYVDWLEAQGDPRAEYLRLLATLDETTDPDAGGPARQRLRALREQAADPAWVEAVDRTLIGTHGIYQARWSDGGFACLRFYADGSVLSVSTTGTADEIDPWFRKDRPSQYPNPVSEGRWTVRADRLSFFIPHPNLADPDRMHPRFSGDLEGWRRDCEDWNAKAMQQRTDYAGVVGPGTIALRWHRFGNGAEGMHTYHFVPSAT